MLWCFILILNIIIIVISDITLLINFWWVSIHHMIWTFRRYYARSRFKNTAYVSFGIWIWFFIPFWTLLSLKHFHLTWLWLLNSCWLLVLKSLSLILLSWTWSLPHNWSRCQWLRLVLDSQRIFLLQSWKRPQSSSWL